MQLSRGASPQAHAAAAVRREGTGEGSRVPNSARCRYKVHPPKRRSHLKCENQDGPETWRLRAVATKELRRSDHNVRAASTLEGAASGGRDTDGGDASKFTGKGQGGSK